MARIFNLFLMAFIVSACTRGGDKTTALPLEFGGNTPFTLYGNRMPVVENPFPGYYNIRIVETDSLHPVMEITYVSRRLSRDDYRSVDAVLRMDITNEQRALFLGMLHDATLLNSGK